MASYTIESSNTAIQDAQIVMFDNSIRRIEIENIIDYDLFPYQIKDRSKFLEQDHPQQINPNSFTFKNYWGDFAKKSMEGMWVEDSGTWVYMPPKLFFYINYLKIIGSKGDSDKQRTTMSPDLSCLEWICFSYIFVADGFSGFKGDETYTCNEKVKLLWLGEDLNKFDEKDIKENCYQKNGRLKIYVDPWEYLTRFYLIDNPRGNLGDPLYENKRKDILISGARGCAKSYIAYYGDFLHEWLFQGYTSYDFKEGTSGKLLFSMHSGSRDAINKSANLVRTFYDNQPGKYSFPGDRPDYMGPFYKNVVGTWAAGSDVTHQVKTKQNSSVIAGSLLQIGVLTADRKRIGAGDRYRRMYVEEGGLIDFIREVHATNKDSTEDGDNKVGSMYITGTAGDIHAIEGMKAMILNPAGYGLAEIPNYWKDNGSSISLFVSALYKYRKFQDSNGNRDLNISIDHISKLRARNLEVMDSSGFDESVLNNPINPDEMLRPNRRSFMPKIECSKRKGEIEDYKLFSIHANIGDLKWDKSERYGVGFKKDTTGRLKPITKYNIDRQKIDVSGAYVIYEQPPEDDIPEGLYWVLFDPVAKPGRGQTLDSSLNVAFVYKYFHTGSDDSLEDSIVAEWIGREDELDDGYDRVIKLAKYYNAKIFPETNTPGFVDYCKRNSYYPMLQGEAYIAEREINPKYRKTGAVGYSIYGQKKKPWLLQKLKSWITRKRGLNKDGTSWHSQNYDHILSERFLDEVINFDEDKGNYDYISAALGLMLLLSQFREEPIEVGRKEDDEPEIIYEYKPVRRRRSSFEQSMY